MARTLLVATILAAAAAAVGACGGRGGSGGGTDVVGGGAPACLPAVAEGQRLGLVTAGGQAHVCRERLDDRGSGAWRPDACWLVDLATGALARADLVAEPGRGQPEPATWTEAGLCARGYCVPGEPGGAADDPVLILAVGEQVAAAIGPDDEWHLFDAGKRRVTRPPPGERDDGPGASPAEPRVVGDVVFIADLDAGPHADVHAYARDGRYLGMVRDPDGSEEAPGDFELYNGTVSTLSAHEVAFVEHRLVRVLVVDTRAGTTTVWHRRLGRPAPCSLEERDLFLDPVDVDLEFAIEDGTITAACLQALEASDGRFGPAGVARAADGALVTLARAPGGHALVHFDRAGAIAREVPVASCAR